MERKEKIEFLKALQKGKRNVEELLIKDSPIVIDENDTRPIIEIIKNNCGSDIIMAKDFEKRQETGLIKGFVIDLREGKYTLLSFQ